MNISTLLVLFSIVSLQCGASFAKTLFPVLGATGATTLRIFFASLILLVMFRPWKKKTFRKLDKRTKKIIFLYGTSLGIMNLLFYKALQTLPQGITVALEFIGPLTLAIVLSRKTTDFIWALLAIAGILLLVQFDGSLANLDGVGVVFALCAGVCWAFYILLGQKLGTSSHGTSVIAYGMCMASLVTLPFGIASKGAELVQIKLLPTVLAVALLSSVIPYTLELRALKHLSAKTFGILMSLEPAVAAIVAYFFLKEELLLAQWVGIFSISIASLGTTLFSEPIKAKLIK